MAFVEFRETMSGSYRLLRGPSEERPISFTLRALSQGLPRFLARPVVEIAGEVDAEAFADHRAMRGTLGLDFVRTGRIPYAFAFDGNDGRAYRFRGHKTVSLASLVDSMTVLPGAILDAAGAEVATAMLRFDLRHDLGKFLRSWKVRR